MKEKAGAEEGEAGSGEAGSGETGSGETGSGETGSGEMGYGGDGVRGDGLRVPPRADSVHALSESQNSQFPIANFGDAQFVAALQNSLMQCRTKKVTLYVRRIFAGRAEK